MRKKRVYKKFYEADPKFDRIDIGRFINYVMEEGKRSTAERIVYDAFEKIKTVTKEDPAKVFDKALENASPLLEVVSRRVGGANYQIPEEVKPGRKFVLAIRWIIKAARTKKGKPMAEKLAEEIIAASKNEGAAIKKKQDTHRMAEANRAFAHFARKQK
ncbi:MAG: 30S ribosomal protein S7 [Candidatus Ryanbacteria bacterium RIFCSPLOWO2_01_FULL_48_26]|uniref:Small ribosomal subunit protein uS7 n=1 Tax=Candidatus Ryanbacteria bacterium RIFCSPLOWO2_01_FULL_48_26 TaxID=1802126 RepID=A0A1G2GU02_9BACT|nr:MAG: 30S ribosomal protein S7 [Candidatus Ryanbacteria bacterium RIFCSPLOWO2_01_FULL_48_26]